MTPPSTTRQRPSGVHNGRSRTQPRQRIRSLPLTVVERAALSDQGLRRTSNQDSFHVGDRLFAVADGVGGAQAGDIASRLAVAPLAAGERGGSSQPDLLAL